MKLKHEKIEYIEVNYCEFDKLIKEIYKHPSYEFVADREAHNDSCYRFCSVKKEPLEEWDMEDLKKFKNGKWPIGITNILLTDMCNNGIIEPGEYLISVCW